MAEDEKVDGARIAAEILSRMTAPNRDRIVQSIKERSPEIHAKIQGSLFRFEEILEVSDQGIQLLLQRVSPADVPLVLKTAGAEIRNTFFKNMSERAGARVREEIEALPPVRISEVEAAQRRIGETLRELRDSGQIRSRASKGVWV